MIINNDTFCVYMHINRINNKIYVGQTKYGYNPNKRWRDGDGYNGCTYFYQAIQKYGWDNFDHEIIASNLTEYEANSFEEMLIQQLKTSDAEYGYNLKSGGQNHSWSEISILKRVKSYKDTIREKHRVVSDVYLKDRFEQGDPFVKKCIKCGVLFEVCGENNISIRKSMKKQPRKFSKRMCNDCCNDTYNKTENVIKKCIDCGAEFICKSLATKKIRCDECQRNANKCNNRERQKTLYNKIKNNM